MIRGRTGHFIINGVKHKNRIMDAILNETISILLGTASDLEIKFLAVGTDGTAITNTQTQLGAETQRYAPTASPSLTGVGTVTTTFTILNTESLVYIKEIGIFVGASATSTLNSGKMLARLLVDIDRTTEAVQLNIIRIDQEVRA